jgi:hypothetical protein
MNWSDYNWGKMNRFLKWALTIYLIANTVIVFYIWLNLGRRHDPAERFQDHPRPMQNVFVRELNLSGEQEEKFKAVENHNRKETDTLISQILSVKKEIAAEIFKANPDTNFVNLKIKQIGNLQEKIEKNIFNNFLQLSKICNDEQKGKLKEVFQDITGRFGPKGGQMRQNFPPPPPMGD